MNIECVDSSGFESDLSNDGIYKVLATGAGDQSYLIENDNGQERWYGCSKFKISKASL